jgi:hypothetical protein
MFLFALASWVRCAAPATVICATALVGATHASAESINWRLENPFRLFLDPGDTARHRAAYEALSLDEKLRPVLAAERQLAAAAPRGWAEAIVDRTCWSQTSQLYACNSFEDYVNPTSHRIVAHEPSAAASGGTCTWSVAPLWPGSTAPPAVSLVPCGEHVVLDVPYPTGARVSVAVAGRTLASSDIRVRDIFIVGIGDSYASGDGNPDIPVTFDDRRAMNYQGNAPETLEGYPARAGTWSGIQDAEFTRHGAGWLSTGCHRSLYSHQLRAALQLSIEDPHRAVTFASFACWGSDVVTGIFLPMTRSKLVPGLPSQSQLSAIAALQCGRARAEVKRWPRAFDVGGKLPFLADLDGLHCPGERARKIDLLLVTVGGNDIGFAQLVTNAVLADTNPLRNIGSALGQLISPQQALANLSQLVDRYKVLNRAARSILHIPWSESDRIVLTGYPPIALQDAGGEVCATGRQGMTVIPGLSLDQRRASDSEFVAEKLYATMRNVARHHGWTLADAHRITFARHGLCAGAIGSLSNPADDVRLPRLVDGFWRPYPPSGWQPFASRKRWIRTPNDGYMTVNFHVGDIDRTPINLILASTYSGAFHPTAEGQAAMADAVADKARAVLDRYAATKPN